MGNCCAKAKASENAEGDAATTPNGAEADATKADKEHGEHPDDGHPMKGFCCGCCDSTDEEKEEKPPEEVVDDTEKKDEEQAPVEEEKKEDEAEEPPVEEESKLVVVEEGEQDEKDVESGAEKHVEENPEEVEEPTEEAVAEKQDEPVDIVEQDQPDTDGARKDEDDNDFWGLRFASKQEAIAAAPLLLHPEDRPADVIGVLPTSYQTQLADDDSPVLGADETDKADGAPAGEVPVDHDRLVEDAKREIARRHFTDYLYKGEPFFKNIAERASLSKNASSAGGAVKAAALLNKSKPKRAADPVRSITPSVLGRVADGGPRPSSRSGRSGGASSGMKRRDRIAPSVSGSSTKRSSEAAHRAPVPGDDESSASSSSLEVEMIPLSVIPSSPESEERESTIGRDSEEAIRVRESENQQGTRGRVAGDNRSQLYTTDSREQRDDYEALFNDNGFRHWVAESQALIRLCRLQNGNGSRDIDMWRNQSDLSPVAPRQGKIRTSPNCDVVIPIPEESERHLRGGRSLTAPDSFLFFRDMALVSSPATTSRRAGAAPWWDKESGKQRLGRELESLKDARDAISQARRGREFRTGDEV
ncbi:unnamed protein product [Amoebophrya sp. A120]|nr:unnamed protein product [Amoebophrya sp. A120]|eukprot:GSA120T00003096001.1